MSASARGSCLCGGVVFEAEPPFRIATHCHCSRCRKHSGTFGLTQGRVPNERFRLLSGEDLLRVWDPGDGGKVKVFCSVCGSSVFGGEWPDGDEVSIRLGAFDDDPEIRPSAHVFVDSAAPWFALPNDGLPRHPGRLP